MPFTQDGRRTTETVGRKPGWLLALDSAWPLLCPVYRHILSALAAFVRDETNSSANKADRLTSSLLATPVFARSETGSPGRVVDKHAAALSIDDN